MAAITVHVISEHAGDGLAYGCSYIRDTLPLGHPANQGRLRMTASFEYEPADVVIVERAWEPHASPLDADGLVERARKDGACLIHSIDDALLDADSVPAAARNIVRNLCRSAAGVLVSTELLRARLEHLNPNIHVLPNALDERLFFDDDGPSAPAPKGGLVVGFMGTATHDRDLMLVVQALRGFLRRHASEAELQVVGGLGDPGWMALFDGLPARRLPVPAESVAYPGFVRWMRRDLRWDIGLAPLEDSALNRAKSDIKFLDYAALGVAGLYSSAPAYAGAVRHLETGVLVGEAPEGWRDALEMLAGDAALRAAIAARAQAYVRSERTLERRATAWSQAIETTLEAFRTARRT